MIFYHIIHCAFFFALLFLLTFCRKPEYVRVRGYAYCFGHYMAKERHLNYIALIWLNLGLWFKKKAIWSCCSMTGRQLDTLHTHPPSQALNLPTSHIHICLIVHEPKLPKVERMKIKLKMWFNSRDFFPPSHHSSLLPLDLGSLIYPNQHLSRDIHLCLL